jgi:pilus assembly protein CpaB
MQTFRSNTTVMIALAVVFGGAAVFLARAWLQHQANLKDLSKPAPEVVSQATIVVAAEPLHFGAILNRSSLREIPWPSNALPEGYFSKLDDVLSQGKRVALEAMRPNEPVLKGKITGPGQRAGLASIVGDGQRAVSLRVNDVNGVAGFVLPGDRVDIMVGQSSGGNSGSDVVLQNVRVLAIDQLVDNQVKDPSLAKTVTIETNIAGAQKVSLASLVGTLSLTLRSAGDTAPLQTRRVTLADLTRPEETSNQPTFMMSAPGASLDTTVRVRRAAEQKEYNVPREK